MGWESDGPAGHSSRVAGAIAVLDVRGMLEAKKHLCKRLRVYFAADVDAESNSLDDAKSTRRR